MVPGPALGGHQREGEARAGRTPDRTPQGSGTLAVGREAVRARGSSAEPEQPKDEAPGGGDEKKDEGPQAQTIRDASGEGWYLQVNQGGQEDGTQVGQNPRWTGDEFGRNQWWIIHHYPENNSVALEAASAPGSVVDLKSGTNQVQIEGVSAENLESGELSENQKWRLVDTDNGRTRIVNTSNNECLTDMQNDKGAITWTCSDGPNEQQDWKISDGP